MTNRDGLSPVRSGPRSPGAPPDGQSGDLPVGKDATADEIADDIAHTRGQLGDTADALVDKFDVKAQAKHSAHDATQRVQDRVRAVHARVDETTADVRAAATDERRRPSSRVLVAAAAVLLVGSVLAVVWRRRRR